MTQATQAKADPSTLPTKEEQALLLDAWMSLVGVKYKGRIHIAPFPHMYKEGSIESILVEHLESPFYRELS